MALQAMATDEQLGPLVRLWGIGLGQLPPTTATAEELAPFLRSVLQEATRLLDSVAPRSLPLQNATSDDAKAVAGTTTGTAAAPWKAKRRKRPTGSRAPVELLERRFSTAELGRIPSAPAAGRGGLQAETWICRRSVHEDAAVAGSASWAEFLDGLKDRHAETEAAFTPSIVTRRTAATWECGAVEVQTAEAGGGGCTTTWGGFTLAAEEVRHRIGRPLLQDRVFAVLQLTCAVVAPPSDEFVVVNMPIVDSDGGGEGKDQAQTAADVARDHRPRLELARGGRVVVGAYASVERVRRLRPGEAEAGKIEWIMATASDARGVLPAKVQTMAVPSQIVKDVPWFLTWAAQQRPAGTAAV